MPTSRRPVGRDAHGAPPPRRSRPAGRGLPPPRRPVGRDAHIGPPRRAGVAPAVGNGLPRPRCGLAMTERLPSCLVVGRGLAPAAPVGRDAHVGLRPPRNDKRGGGLPLRKGGGAAQAATEGSVCESIGDTIFVSATHPNPDPPPALRREPSARLAAMPFPGRLRFRPANGAAAEIAPRLLLPPAAVGRNSPRGGAKIR